MKHGIFNKESQTHVAFRHPMDVAIDRHGLHGVAEATGKAKLIEDVKYEVVGCSRKGNKNIEEYTNRDGIAAKQQVWNADGNVDRGDI